MDFIGLTYDTESQLDGRRGHIYINFVKYPSALYFIRNCAVTVTCDQSVTFYDTDLGAYLSTTTLVDTNNIEKNNVTYYTGRYNLSEPQDSYAISVVKFPNIRREVRIDPWGYMFVYEEHLVQNDGPYGNFKFSGDAAHQKFIFNIPIGADNFYAYDKFGRLAYRVEGENNNNISISLDNNRYTLQRGETTFYWVTYRIPLPDYIERNGDKMKLNLDILFGTFDCLVETFDIILILPKGASLKYISPSVDSITTIDQSLHLIFNETDVTALCTNIIEIEIDLSKAYFYFLSRPLIFLLIFVALCSGYVISKRALPSEERLLLRKTVVPTPVLLEFCSLFEEKTSLVTEIEKLDEDLKKRKIKKRLYRSQRKTAERKILELDKDIDELKSTLKEAGGRFSQIVNELEINEAERQSAKDGLYNLEKRYPRKKISIVAYQKLRKDLLNRHKKSKTKLDKLIFELREILS